MVVVVPGVVVLVAGVVLVDGVVVLVELVVVELVEGVVVVVVVEVVLVELVVELVELVAWHSRSASAPTVLAPWSRFRLRVGLRPAGRSLTSLLNCTTALEAELQWRASTAAATESRRLFRFAD